MREVDLKYGTVEGQAAAKGLAMQFPVDLRESTDHTSVPWMFLAWPKLTSRYVSDTKHY